MIRLVAGALICVSAYAQTSASNLWGELEKKRSVSPGFRQEFEILRTNRSSTGTVQTNQWHVGVEWAGSQWREQRFASWGTNERIFAGAEVVTLDQYRGEFLRTKMRPRDKAPLPAPYSLARDLTWAKAQEVRRQPCDNGTASHLCVIVQVPLAQYTEFSSGGGPLSMRFRREGTAMILMDNETGLLLQYLATEIVEESGTVCTCEIRYTSKESVVGPLSSQTFTPSLTGLKEVKSFSIWDAKQVQKALAGKPAPELTGIDLEGNKIALSSLRGKTVLLDFWATWCPPCRADGPALNKLQAKYGNDLVVLGVSVGEDPKVVKEYLKAHAAKYPIVLGSEYELPWQFQVQLIPTYIALDANGSLIATTSGAQGFSELRKLLKKAGLDVD